MQDLYVAFVIFVIGMVTSLALLLCEISSHVFPSVRISETSEQRGYIFNEFAMSAIEIPLRSQNNAGTIHLLFFWSFVSHYSGQRVSSSLVVAARYLVF